LTIFHPNVFKGFVAFPVLLLVEEPHSLFHLFEMLGSELTVVIGH
jgi:hypothetical protein